MANLVSYVITTFNSEDCIEGTLECLVNQDYENKEIIVVDNCSSDSTKDIIDEYEDVNVINMPNSDYGACETFNIGFENANGDYVAIMDDDVRVEEDFTKKLVERLESRNLCAVVPKTIHTGENSEEEMFTEEREISAIAGNASLVRRDCMKEVSYYDQRFFIDQNDNDLGKKLSKAGHRIETYPDVEVIHLRDPEESISGFRLFYRARNKHWVAWKHFPLRIVFWFSLFNLYRRGIEALKSGNILPYIKGNLAALGGLYTYGVKEREPSKDIEYREWSLKEALGATRREIKRKLRQPTP